VARCLGWAFLEEVWVVIYIAPSTHHNHFHDFADIPLSESAINPSKLQPWWAVGKRWMTICARSHVFQSFCRSWWFQRDVSGGPTSNQSLDESHQLADLPPPILNRTERRTQALKSYLSNAGRYWYPGSISVRHGDAGDAVASLTLKNWSLFGQIFSKFGQSTQLHSYVSAVVSVFQTKAK